MSEKLQKVLARSGLGSRRELEAWIEAGRVSVNGQVATLGDRVETDDRILVDGKPVRGTDPDKIPPRVILYHKPVGEVSSRSDPQGRPTVFDHLPRLKEGRWVQVGRLDLTTSGLLLFTTDGELAHGLMHPSLEFEREYAVRVRGTLSDEQRRAMLEGVELDDGLSKFLNIEDAGGSEDAHNHWYKVTLIGGRYREVRRMFEAQGLDVSRLMRVRFGDISLPPQLREGRWMDLPAEQTRELVERVGLKGRRYTGLYGRGRMRSGRGQRPDPGSRPPRKPRRNPYRR